MAMNVETHILPAPDKPIDLTHDVKWQATCDPMASHRMYEVVIWTAPDGDIRRTYEIEAPSDERAVFDAGARFCEEVVKLRERA